MSDSDPDVLFAALLSLSDAVEAVTSKTDSSSVDDAFEGVDVLARLRDAADGGDAEPEPPFTAEEADADDDSTESRAAPFVPAFRMPAGLAPPPDRATSATVRILCVQPPVLDFTEIAGYLSLLLTAHALPTPPQLVVFPADCWGHRICPSVRKARFVQDVCRVAGEAGVFVLLGGVWEGPRVDSLYYQTSILIGPTLPSLPDAAPDGDASAAAGGARGGSSAQQLAEVVATCHQRSVCDERQVPGVFPTCAVTRIGSFGLAPDADVHDAAFVAELLSLGSSVLLNPSGSHSMWASDEEEEVDTFSPTSRAEDVGILFDQLRAVAVGSRAPVVHVEPCYPFGRGVSMVVGPGGDLLWCSPTNGELAFTVDVPHVVWQPPT